MTLIKVFWIFVAFYAVVKACFFVGVYFVSKAIERRALAEKAQRVRTIDQITELENVVALYERKLQKAGKEKGSEESSKRFVC